MTSIKYKIYTECFTSRLKYMIIHRYKNKNI